MEADVVEERPRGHAQAGDDLVAGDDRGEQLGPVAPSVSAAASAAGTIATLTWAIDPVCVSSKSSAWQVTAL